MADYQQLTDPVTSSLSDYILRRADNAFIPNDPENRDRQEYDAWVAAGNTPDPPPAPPS